MRAFRTPLARRWAAIAFVLVVAGPARAQFFTPPSPSTRIDTSIRSAAMGGASAAVMWGEPGVWANPATLAGVNGIGWVAGHTKVVPELSDNDVFTSQRLLLGGGGVGFSSMGKPISGFGKAKFDVPSASIPLGGTSDELSDQTEGWAVGVSPLKLIESIRKLAHMGPGGLTSYGDVAVGYQAKSARLSIGSSEFGPADTYDWGVNGRLALSRWWGEDATFRLSLSGAYSQINVPTSETRAVGFDRTALALRLSPAPPSERSASPPSLPWWRPGDVPELSIGLAYDHDLEHLAPFGTSSSSIDHYGFEATVFRLLALRLGYVSDPDSDIEGMTYGGGLTLPIGPWASVGYELASVPLPSGLDRQFRQGWSVWLEPARIWGDMR